MLRALTLALAVLAISAAPAGADCAWQVRNDPVAVNALYPDADAIYYIAALPRPVAGSALTVTGTRPAARYMSFVAYDGLPMAAVLDEDLPAEYTLRIVSEPRPADPRPDTLYLGKGQLGLSSPVFYLYYRLYVPQARRGGVPLPEVALADTTLAGPCEDARDALPPAGEVHDAYTELQTPTVPFALRTSTSPPAWSVESGLTAGALGATGQDGAVSGGPGSNPHTLYVAAPVSRANGELLVIHGKAPTTPPTAREGEAPDLRYWSFCQNSRTTRYVACLSDHRVQLDEAGAYTIVVAAARPAGAENWIPFGPEPEGQILFRHMLPSEAFLPHSAQGAGEPLEASMGAYFPRATYCSAAAFAEDRCAP